MMMKQVSSLENLTTINTQTIEKGGDDDEEKDNKTSDPNVTTNTTTTSLNSSTTTTTTTTTIASMRSTFSYWNPLTWLNYSLNDANSPIEQIESKMFASIKCHANLSRFFVYLRNDSLKIWTVSVNVKSPQPPIVLVHGFCGAVAMWIHNIDALSENRPFYAFDLLGFGRSSRPNFSTDPIVAEQQFVESIEDWRKELCLNNGMILMGHSFGGYLSAAYAIKYPQHVRALLLCDPWGFPEIPSNKSDTPVPMWVNAIAKISQYVSPLAIFRVTGQVGVKVFKHLRPDFKRKYMDILDNPEIIYSYLYYANTFSPR
jgi:pimeloyl-ACP methyl ester carboxylesterase